MIDRENKELRRIIFENDESDFDFNNGYNDRPIEWFKKLILSSILENSDKKNSILDVGCASGYFTKEFTPYFKYIVGVDFSTRRIEFAKKHETDKLKFFNYDLTKDSLTNLSTTFDTIFTNAVLPHIPLENKVSVLENLASVAKQNAQLLIYDGRSEVEIIDQFVGMFNENWLINNVSHVWEFVSINKIDKNTYLYKLIKK
jgi:2-polyprenyl-3-methyl-5-hydroxy-6-metoxy-1,4-benzoquinol methylase